MPKVNVKENIRKAALALFCEKGFSKTSIAAIELAAGLAPRAGAFYRHFESKEALLTDLAREKFSETPEDFDFAGVLSFSDTRAELIALARQFELASERQKPYLRLIEEVRLLNFGQDFERYINERMIDALMGWVETKSRGRGLAKASLAALTMNVFGSWLFYLSKRQQNIEIELLDRDCYLKQWAELWAKMLDSEE